MKTSMRVVSPTTVPNTKIKKKNSVRFSQLVHITPFERASPTEARDIWFTSSEIGSIKRHAKRLAIVYREFGGIVGANAAATATAVPQQQQQQQPDDIRSIYRGFENCTATRQRRRLLANRSVVYAHKNGMSDSFVAEMYKQCNQWSGEVAFVQAVHDYIDVFYTSPNKNNNNNNNYSSSCNQEAAASRAALAAMMIPPVTSMVPPPEVAFAVQSAYALRAQKKRQRRQQQQQQQQQLILLLQQQQLHYNASLAVLASGTCTDRRVRARVW